MADNSRILWIHRRIMSGSYPNAYRLAEKFHISNRQAHRDFVYLREQLGAPLEYDSSRRGFHYTRPFSLPISWVDAEDVEYYTLFSGQKDDDRQITQMQIPYTARIRIGNKLAEIELKDFIKKRLEPHIFQCEFQGIERFLSAIFLCDADVEILEPLWLREKIVSNAAQIINSHRNKKS